MLDHLNEYNDLQGQILSSKNLKEAVLRVMEELCKEIERNNNNIRCNISFQSLIAMIVQKKDASWSLKRRLASSVLAQMVQNFKGCTAQSTIIDSAHSNSKEQVDVINDSEEQVDTKNWLRNDYA